MSSEHYAVAIVGAGPYGLAQAAKLSAASIKFVLFGRPMCFWQENVPLGTRLNSGWVTSSLGDGAFDHASYLTSIGASPPTIFTAEQFIAYALWFQGKVRPDPDRRCVTHLARNHRVYRLRLDDASQVTADRVVICTGLRPFAVRPPQFGHIPDGLVFHTSDLHNLKAFSKKTVAIIGSGQSAMDCAALLSEQDADVEVIARAKAVRWKGYDAAAVLPSKPTWTLRGALQDLRTDPWIYRYLPSFVRTLELNNALRATAVRSLLPRVQKVRLTLGQSVIAASVKDDAVQLQLNNQTTRKVDYVVLGTGYRVDVGAIPFLSTQMREKIRTHHGYPELSSKMESSVPGLFFAGVTAAWSFGPMMWLIRGAPWAAKIISREIINWRVHSEEKINPSSVQLGTEQPVELVGCDDP